MTPTPGAADDGAFDETNPCYQRYRQLIDAHFDVVEWRTDDGNDLAMTTVVDPYSGTAFTMHMLDAFDTPTLPAACTVLYVDTADRLGAFGIFTNAGAAIGFARRLGATTVDVAYTRSVRLHPPLRPLPQRDRWPLLPPGLTLTLDPHAVRPVGFAVLLHDPLTGRVLPVGPFDIEAGARQWTGTTLVGVARHVLPIGVLPAGSR